MISYYIAILFLSFANLALAAIAYRQRAKQIRGNQLRERQLELAETNNRLAEIRLRCLDDQLAVLGEIRRAVCAGRARPTVGVIDIGSATVRLAVARYDPWQATLVQVCKQGSYMGLGAEVERRGAYSEETLDRLGKRLRTLVAAAEDEGCEQLAIVITAPGRNGSNPEELVQVVRRAGAREPHLLTPEQEARLAFAGATMSPPGTGTGSVVVCDVGGGSTEVAVGTHPDGVIATASFDLGAFALAERHFHHDPPTPSELAAAREDAEEALNLEQRTTPTLALATGGSARAIAKLAGRVLGKAELATALSRATSPKSKVKNPNRRRTLPAGILILDVLHSSIDMPLTITSSGLREGVLLHLTQLDRPRLAHPSLLAGVSRAARAA
jgi:exopolyphosphatase / guanosine-5'-triphosphate,3'-diphosphate pyrophosphatase